MADFSTDEKANLLLKKYFNKSSTFNSTPYFQENPIYNARTSIFNTQIWSQSDRIPISAPNGGTTDTTGTDDSGNTLDGSTIGKTISVGGINILKKYIRLQLQEVPGSNGTAFYYPDTANNNASLLKYTIPFDFDPINGSYEYKLYKHGSSNTIINFGEGEWVLDTDTGILTFYQISGISNVSATKPPKISFYKYIGSFGSASSNISSGNEIQISSGNAKVECIDTSGPVGDSIRFFTGENSTAERIRIDKDGNVGIGITNPIYKLDVEGTIRGGSVTDGTLSLNNGKIVGARNIQLTQGAGINKVLTSDSYGNAIWKSLDDLNFTNGVNNDGIIGSLTNDLIWTVTNNVNQEQVVIDNSGRVGIGKLNPYHRLEVNGTIKATGSFTNGILSFYHGTLAGLTALQLVEGAGANKILVSDEYGNATWQSNVLSGSISSGFVSSGSISSAEKIHEGYAKVECFDTNGNLGDYIKFYTGSTASNERVIIDTNGNVGIGITNPSTELDVQGTVKSNSLTDGTMSLNNGNIIGARNIQLTQGAGINKVLVSDSYGNALWKSLDDLSFTNGANNDGIIGSLSSDLIWSVTNNVNQEQVVIDNSGRMGIGKLNPYHRLEVNGSIKATGSFTNGISSLYHGSLTGLTSLQLVHGAGANKVLVSDAYGNATWQTKYSGSALDSGNAKVELVSQPNNNNFIQFLTSSGGVLKEHMRLDKDGNLGIGVTDPDQKLELNGIFHIGQEQSTTPTTPGQYDGGLIYVKNDGKLYYLSHTLDEYNLSEQTGGTGSITASLIKCSTITDGTITINNGTLSCNGDSGFIEANIGSFTNLYTNDLFVEDDVIINGNTTYINSSQISFEDELLSLGATDGMTIASISSNQLTIYCETDVPISYNSSSYVLLMLDNGEKEIFQVSNSSNNTINFSSQINVNTKYVSLISTESIADGSGIEILAHNNGTLKTKKIHYVHDNSNPTMEVMSDNNSLDLRVSNSNGTSFFSVLDKDNKNNIKHKQLLTSDALYLNTSNTGTITGSTEDAAIYLSKNGGDNDSNGDWRFKVEGSADQQTVIMQQYDGSSWITKWTVN
jgi:hypothetical protein